MWIEIGAAAEVVAVQKAPRGALAQSCRHQPYFGVIEADTAADRVNETGVAAHGGVGPHGGVGVDSGGAAGVALDEFAINFNVHRAGRPVAEAKFEGDHARA